MKKICPKCKSENLNFKPWLGMMYECRKCGWQGALALEKKKVSSRDI